MSVLDCVLSGRGQNAVTGPRTECKGRLFMFTPHVCCVFRVKDFIHHTEIALEAQFADLLTHGGECYCRVGVCSMGVYPG